MRGELKSNGVAWWTDVDDRTVQKLAAEEEKTVSLDVKQSVQSVADQT